MSPTDDPWADRLLNRYARLPSDEAEHLRRNLYGLASRVVANAELAPDAHVLDVGAGTGLVTDIVASSMSAKGRIISLDQSMGCLRTIQTRASDRHGDSPPVDLLRAELPDVPLASSSLDAVLCRSVLMYVADRSRALREFARVLRPDGRVSLYEMLTRDDSLITDAFDLSPLGDLADRVRDHELAQITRSTDPVLTITLRSLCSDVTAAGLRIMAVEPHRAPIPGFSTNAMDEEFLERLFRHATAPGETALVDRWANEFTPDERERLERRLRAHLGTPVEFSRRGVHLVAVKPGLD